MYKIGTRVKKVRGTNIGMTGIVCHGPALTGRSVLSSGENIFVRMDVEWDGYKDGVLKARNPAGTVGATHSDYWEKIIPEGSNVPSEATIHQLLDSKFYEKENCNV